MKKYNSFVDLLEFRSEELNNKIVFTYLSNGEIEGLSISYRELRNKALGIAEKLRQGTVKGDRAILLYSSGIDFITAFFGCLYAEVIAVPTIAPTHVRYFDRLNSIILDSQPAVALTTSAYITVINKLPAQSLIRGMNLLATDSILPDDHTKELLFNVRSSDISFLQYTSGSTGKPKGIMVSHNNLIANSEYLRKCFQHSKESLSVNWLPNYHDMGLIDGILQPIYTGYTSIIIPPVAFLEKPLRWLQAVSRYKATHSGSPNFGYELCAAKVQESDYANLDLSTWRTAYNGAEPIRQKTLENFFKVFSRCGFDSRAFYPCYGLAESTLIVSGGFVDEAPKHISLCTESLGQNIVKEVSQVSEKFITVVGCGHAWTDTKVRIIHPELLTPCPEDTVGEIWISGESVAIGYWNKEAETEATFNAFTAAGEGPFLRSGDLGFIKNDELFITGRLKDLIIINGKNFYPQDIELTVEKSHHDLRSGCTSAFSIIDQEVEKLVIVQEVDRSFFRNPNPDEIYHSIIERVFKEYELNIHSIVLIKTGTIPKTSSGKIQRRACCQKFIEGSLSIVGQWRFVQEEKLNKDGILYHSSVHQSAIQEFLIERISAKVGISKESISTNVPFASLGLNSIISVEIAHELSEWLGNKIPPTVVFDYPNIKSLSVFLSARRDDIRKKSANDRNDQIAIIGIGNRFPRANNPNEFWHLLKNGGDAIVNVPKDRWIPEAFQDIVSLPSIKYGGFIENIEYFDPQFFGVSPREAAQVDPQQRLLLEVAWEALEDAGIKIEHIQGSKTGVFVGISNSDYGRQLLSNKRSDIFSVTGQSLSIAANRISYTWDLKGPSIAIDTACSSSLVAVHQASQSLLNSECDMAIAGGVNIMIDPTPSIYFSKAGMLSSNGKCRTFDSGADGYVRGEGCGIIILKRLKDAMQDGDYVYAVIKGSAVNQNGKGYGLTSPNGPSQVQVITDALTNAGVEPHEVGYVEAHGTGTPLGDSIELNALQQVYAKGRDSLNTCTIGSVKPNIGHLEAAAGIAGLIKTVLAIHHKEIPRNLNFATLNTNIDFSGLPLNIPTNNVPWHQHKRIAGVSSFGFGGTNVHLIVSEFVREKETDVSSPINLLTLSAKDENGLKSLCQSYLPFLVNSGATWEEICYASNFNRTKFSHSIAITAPDKESAIQILKEFPTHNNIISGVKLEDNSPKKVFLYPGQGFDWKNKGTELYKRNKAFREAINNCNDLIKLYQDKPLLDILFNTIDSNYLSNTAYTQPALFSFEYALTKLWQSWGINPELVLGHSVGEYAAACTAGIFSLEDSIKLVVNRGKLMQDLAVPGGMVTIFEGIEEASKIIKDYHDQVSIAANNGPQQVVISGELSCLAEIMDRLKKDKIPYKRLNVSHAFHSTLMQPMCEPYEKVLREVSFFKPKIQIISNITGQIAPDQMSEPNYWLKQITSSVDYFNCIKTAQKLGAKFFVEMGQQDNLTQITKSCVRDKDVKFLMSMDAASSEWEQIERNIGVLSANGVDINWERIYNERSSRKITLPNYPFQRSKYGINSIGSTVVEQTTVVEEHGQLPDQELILKLKKIVGKIIKEDPSKINVNKALLGMGVDSILLIELIRKIENEFQVALTIRQLFNDLQSIQAIADHIKSLNHHTHIENVRIEETETTSSSDVASKLEGINKSFQSLTAQLLELNNSITTGSKDGVKELAVTKNKKIQIGFNSVKEIKLDEDVQLSPTQSEFLANLIRKYNKKTEKSKLYAQSNKARLADWINSIDFRLSLKEMLYPIVSERSQGSMLWDIDGNQYIDIAIGYGVNFFGNSSALVKEAITNQLEKGFELATQSELAGEVASLICEFTGMERVTFCNTGSEAVMTAIRIARAKTLKNKIILFKGYYHGTFDGNLAQPFGDDDKIVKSVPLAPGTPQSMIDDVIVLDYGSEDAFDIIRLNKDEIAAVLIEPVQSRRPGVFPTEFLRKLRLLTEENSIVLIFDEIITGFRIDRGGAQALLNFKADIAVYGKIVGGGMPIGVVAGSSSLMDTIDGGHWSFGDPSYPKTPMTFFGGTFCKHPLSLAASKAVLLKMKTYGPALQKEVNETTQKMCLLLNRFLEEKNVSIRVINFGSLFRFEGYGEYNSLLRPIELDIFFYSLIEKGVFTWERRICFLSIAHTLEDLEFIILKVKETIAEMTEAGFFRNKSHDLSVNALVNNAKKGNRNHEVPLTNAQKLIWILDKVDEGGSIAHNLNASLSLHGNFKLSALEEAVKTIINRHESLRTIFSADGENQIILDEVTIDIAFTELTNVTPDQVQEKLQENLFKESITKFDLATGPLFRVSVLKINSGHHVLKINVHHIVCDGWSLRVIMNELGVLYSSMLKGKRQVLPAPMQFREYIRLQSENDQKQEDYWLNKIQGQTKFLLPTDRPRKAKLTFNGKRVRWFLDQALFKDIKALAKEKESTNFMVFFSVYTILLNKLSGENKVEVGINTIGRDLDEDKSLVGYCSNVLPAQVEVENALDFSEYLNRVKQFLLQDYEHQQFAITKLMNYASYGENRNGSITSTTFNYDTDQQLPELAGLDVSLCFSPLSYTTHELNFDIVELKDNTLLLECNFNTDLFEEETIVRWVGYYFKILSDVVNNPTVRLKDINLIAQEEKALIDNFNSTDGFYPKEKTIHSLFVDYVIKDKNAIALQTKLLSLSYGDLNQESDKLARYLADNYKIEKGDVIGVLAPRSEYMIIALLGILKCGGIYLPLSEDYPESRIQNIIQESKVKVLLIHSSKLSKLKTVFHLPIFALDIQLSTIDFAKPISLPPVYPDDLAYIIYTSGSTGNPKGVAIEHRGLVNVVWDHVLEMKMKASDNYLQFMSPSFDGSLLDIFTALCSGATLVLVDKDTINQPTEFLKYIDQQQVTLLTITPSYLSLLNKAPMNSVRTIISAGESVRISDALYYASFKDFYNGYGPTEASINTTLHKIEASKDNSIIPIGKPRLNKKVYIVGEGMELLPIGIIGEICIAGVGLARGYVNDEALTNEKFVSSPINDAERLYKTGDLGRWLPSGEIEFFGRKDQQIKINGFRIDLDEITNALLRYKDVKDGAAVVKDNADGEKEIIAFYQEIENDKPHEKIVSEVDEKLAEHSLRRHLAEHLPRYMFPNRLLRVGKLPVNSNGKIDKSALLELALTSISEEHFVQPETPLQHQVAEIWKEILNKKNSGIRDNFFVQGGNSLKAIQLIGKISKVLNVKLDIQDVFDHPTVEELCSRISLLEKEDFRKIEPLKPAEWYELSDAQKRLWIMDKLLTNSTAYNMTGTFELTGEFNKALFEKALFILISRHEILRTVFKEINDVPKQKILSEGDERVCVDYYSAANGKTNDLEKQLIEAQVEYKFDLENGPLIKFVLIERDAQNWLLIINIHHIISDGRSNKIIVEELNHIYSALINGRAISLPPLNIQFKDYAAWQNQQNDDVRLELKKEYWLNVFADEIPVLNLPTDYQRPPVKNFHGNSASILINTEIARRLRNLSENNQGSLFITLMSGVYLLLNKYADQQDIVLGFPVSERSHPDLENQIGFYVNTLVSRIKTDSDTTVESLLYQVRENVIKGLQNQSYPFELLVQQLQIQPDLSRSPVFDVMVSLDSELHKIPTLYQEEGILNSHGSVSSTSKFDLEFIFKEVEGEVLLEVEYSTQLFKESTIARMLQHYLSIVNSMIENPQRRIDELEYIGKAEEEEIKMLSFSGRALSIPNETTFIHLLSQQLKRHPKKIAVVLSTESLSYEKLCDQATRLATLLREKYNIKPNDVVAIQSERSEWMMIGILGILMSGGCYLPIDASAPAERIKFLLENSGAKLILTSPSCSDVDTHGCLHINLSKPLLNAQPFKTLPIVNSGEDLMYLMYTSGTTGRPKGVEVRHLSIINFFASIDDLIDFDSKGKVVGITAYTFDISILELLYPLAKGGQVKILDDEERKDLYKVNIAIDQYKPTLLQGTPSFWNGLIDTGWIGDQSRYTIVCGGDTMSNALASALKSRGKNVWNMYGPTETTIWSSANLVLQGSDAEIIGKPFHNTCIFILDKNERILPIGVVGEICIGGVGVTHGYRNMEILNKERFIESFDGTRLYKTGDFGKWNEDGRLSFVGRRDSQIKIRGYRIELGEIERVLLKHSAVKEVVTIAREDIEKDKTLVSYCICHSQISEEELNDHMLKFLPEYMIPSHIVFLDHFPQTANGKINRKDLPLPNRETGPDRYLEPQNANEQLLAKVWQEVLNLDTVSRNNNFFKNGGHSLKAIAILNAIFKEFGVRLDLKTLYLNPTIEKLAQVVFAADKVEYKPISTRGAAQEHYKLSHAQLRLWTSWRLDKIKSSYNLIGAYKISGVFSKEGFEQAFREVIGRHESLRTIFVEIDGVPYQKIVGVDDVSLFNIESHDYSGYDQDLLPIVEKAENIEIDLMQFPLLRVQMYKLAEEEHLIIFIIHHIVFDGWSEKILIKEVSECYTNFLGGKLSALPPLKIQYIDFTLWQESRIKNGEIKRHREYWLSKFRGNIPTLNLVEDSRKSGVISILGEALSVTLKDELHNKLIAFCEKEKSTPYTVLTSVSKILFLCYSGQKDIIVGCPITGRNHPDLADQVGFYVNILPLRTYINHNDKFIEVMTKVKQTIEEAHEHQDYPFDRLVSELNIERARNHSPIFDVRIEMVNEERLDNFIEGAEVSSIEIPNKISHYDLTLGFELVASSLILHVTYKRDFFQRAFMEKLALSFETILTLILSDPEIRVSDIKTKDRSELFNEPEMLSLNFNFKE